MERNKPPGKRPAKTKGHPPPGDLIALGSKSRSEPDIKAALSGAQPRKVLPSVHGTKREASGVVPGSSLVTKKPKLAGQTFTPLGRPSDDRRASPTTHIYLYEEIAKEAEPQELFEFINDAEDAGDDERVEALLCGSVKYLKMNRTKPETALYITLMYLAKTRTSLFGSEVVIEAFCSLLKRDMSLNFKTKGNPLVSVLTCNVLMAAFQDEENWPDNFVRVYLDDALGERVWVDRPDCKAFVDNIQTAFNTKTPPAYLLQEHSKLDQTSSAAASPNPSTHGDDDDKSMDSTETADRVGWGLSTDDQSIVVFPRYTYQQVSVESQVVEILRDQLNRRQNLDGASRNLLRVMAAACGYVEVRTMAAQRLEMWLQSPKLTKPAQDLLMYVCINCDQHSQQDVEMMSQLSKVRLKTKPLVTHYLLAMKELLGQHPENLRTLMTHTIYNELSNSRNPNNMSLLSSMFQHAAEPSARILAEIFQDLLANRDDYSRALRALLREIVRSVRHDLNFTEFALGLMQERLDDKFRDMDAQFRDRLLLALTDLIALTALVSVTPSVKEAASLHARGEPKDTECLKNFQNQVAIIQRDAVWWLHTVVPSMFEVKPNEYIFCLRKVLFVEKTEAYYKADNWPPDGDRGILMRLVSEVPVLEDTLMRVLVIGLAKELMVNAGDALDLADQLVRRAAMLQAEGYNVLNVERLKLIDAVFNLCTYRHPENIVLPKGYTPPTLAISNLYWKAWIMLLVIAAFNPSTFGRAAWESYPMLRCFMEMAMTNNFRFPPPTMATEEKTIDEIKSKDKQLYEMEKQDILEFEGHLAAATSKVAITEANSLLIAQLTTMDPSGLARKPPSLVLDQLKTLNQSLQIGSLLCRSRDPDFLLDTIQRQGTSQSMPWLAELVESSEGSMDVLPVQCLCEFLLHDALDIASYDDEEETKAEKQKKRRKLHKQEQLLMRLQGLLHSPTADPHTISEVLDYFLQRLSSQQTSSRQLAVKGLAMVLSQSHISDDPDADMDTSGSAAVEVIPCHKWLLQQLPALPLFHTVQSQTCSIIRHAIQVETDAAAVSAYIVFLSQNMNNMQLQELDELALDMAQLIVERSTLITHLLPQEGNTSLRADLVLCSMADLFYNYLKKAQKPQKEAYDWSNKQDQILLQWESSESATMNILVVHAMVILLTFGTPTGDSFYADLLAQWFPDGGHPPTAYLVDTSEEALLLPDWLKLRMIRSSNTRLVEAALQDLEPSQLLLFIQSFGIPVRSMSKLLCCLDNAVELDSATMEQVVVDKGYMAQLISVQHIRGAVGGDKFHTLLKQAQGDEPEANNVEMVSPIRRKRALSQLSRAPELPLSQRDGQQLQQFLCQIFPAGGVVLSTVERQQMYRTLMKNISKEEGFWERVAGAISLILQSRKAEAFVGSLKKYQNLLSPLLRVLVSKQKTKPDRDVLSPLLKLLHEMLKCGPTDAVTSIIAEFFRQQAGHTHRALVQSALAWEKHTQKSRDAALKTVLSAVKQGAPRAESMINTLVCENLQENTTKGQILTTCSDLTTPEQPGMPVSTAGLLVDWLELLDPELVTACPDVQQQLLFAQEKLQESPSGEAAAERKSSSQPYLLALLVHQSSWTSLNSCINLLLKNDSQNSKYSATAVLDFLWACLHIPKIWQGREKKLPKYYEPEDVLCLTSQQIQRIVKYIIEEALESNGKSSEGSGSSGHQVAPQPGFETVDLRIGLLLECCCNKEPLVKAVVDCLYKQMKDNRQESRVCQHLLLQLYLHVPHVLGLMDDAPSLTRNICTAQKGLSHLDAASHRLLSTLGNAAHGATAENKMYDANIACRKLAMDHPLLLLRQLPMIAGLLQGRANFTFGELKHRNHILLYTHVLGILVLLQPHVFRPEYTSLEEVLASYFQLIKLHGMEKRHIAPIINKFVHFLHNFLTQDASRAARMLHQYLSVLSALSQMFPDFVTLKSLLAGLSLPRHEGELPSEAANSTPLFTPSRPTSPWTVSQLAPFQQRISKKSSPEDVLEVLRDLDETSKRKVDLLEHFLGDLKRLMTDTNDEIRNTAHAMVMRHIRHQPSCACEFVPNFIQCLHSPHLDVMNSALKNLAEFVLLAQDEAHMILQKVFMVGIQSKLETGSYLSEAVQLLNMQTLH